jgi:Leucine-rich repeat (LRR) protein
MESLICLRKLDLSFNKIEELGGLQYCSRLVSLMISHNLLKHLGRVSETPQLRQLWVASNRIASLTPEVEALSCLEELNLADNLLASLEQVKLLLRLPSLKVLSLNDPHFGENPVCRLVNYTTYMNYLFPRLQQLDCSRISEELKVQADAIIIKKRMYYNMRIKTISRSVDSFSVKLTDLHLSRRASIYTGLSKLLKAQKKNPQEASRYQPQQRELLHELQSLKEESDAVQEQLDKQRATNIQQLLTEYETGGNMRYESVKPNSKWFHNCLELLQMRVVGGDPLTILKLQHLQNRHLLYRFEEEIENLADLQANEFRTHFEHLMFIPSDPNELKAVVENGFPCPQSSLPCTVLTNFLLPSAKVATVVLCKVFLFKRLVKEDSTLFSLTNLNDWGSRPLAYNQDTPIIYRKSVENDKQRVWFVFNEKLIVPEFLAEITFDQIEDEVAEIREADMLPCLPAVSHFLSRCQEPFHIEVDKSEDPHSTERLKVIPDVPSDWESLDLFNNHIDLLEPLRTGLALKHLDLSFNHIVTLHPLQLLVSLENLYLSHNQIEDLTCLLPLTKLMVLELHFNAIEDTSQIGRLSNCRKLTEASFFNNPITQSHHYEYFVLTQIPSLTTLDWLPVNKLLASQPLSQDLIQASSTPRLGMLTASKIFCENPRNIVVLNLDDCRLEDLRSLRGLTHLRVASFRHNRLVTTAGLQSCSQLEELNFEHNFLNSLGDLDQLKQLKILDLGHNYIEDVQELSELPMLTQLSLEFNFITGLSDLEGLGNLMELYVSFNLISSAADLKALSTLSSLIVLDLVGNMLYQDEDARMYCIFHLRQLKVLDGQSVSEEEQANSRALFEGRLTEEILQSRMGTKTFAQLTELNLHDCKLKSFDNVFNGAKFPALQDLVLSKNMLTNCKLLGTLPTLKRLVLSSNRLETLSSPPHMGLACLPRLEYLDISSNSLQDLIGLSQAKLITLVVLIAANNSLTRVEELEHLSCLEDLNLSRNRIKGFTEKVFPINLRRLNLDENPIKAIAGLSLPRLQVLFLASTRVNDLGEIDRLSPLNSLRQLVLALTPLARKLPSYRLSVIKRLPQLMIVDDREVSYEERERVEMMQDAKPLPMVHLAPTTSQKVPVKLTPINFEGVLLRQLEEARRPPSSNVNARVRRRNDR